LGPALILIEGFSGSGKSTTASIRAGGSSARE